MNIKKGDLVMAESGNFPTGSKWRVYDVAEDAHGQKWLLLVGNTGWGLASNFKVVSE